MQDRFSCPYGLAPIKISTQMTFLGWDFYELFFFWLIEEPKLTQPVDGLSITKYDNGVKPMSMKW